MNSLGRDAAKSPALAVEQKRKKTLSKWLKLFVSSLTPYDHHFSTEFS